MEEGQFSEEQGKEGATHSRVRCRRFVCLIIWGASLAGDERPRPADIDSVSAVKMAELLDWYIMAFVVVVLLLPVLCLLAFKLCFLLGERRGLGA